MHEVATLRPRRQRDRDDSVSFVHLADHVRRLPITLRAWLCATTVALGAVIACGPAATPTLERAQVTLEVSPTPIDSIGRGVLALPNDGRSIKFAVIGDSGRGTPPQYEVAAQMVAFRKAFPYPFVIMLGDNIYEGPASPEDYRTKFEEPYQPLLEAGVKFYAVLGNHDDPRQVEYPPFNMDGHRYYTFVPPEDLITRWSTAVRFFAIDSTSLDRRQIAWLEKELNESRADWKIAFFHHPLYTSGRYRDTARGHRWALEPILTRYGVNVVFSGHEHIYQRSTLQNGIQYFVSGGAGSLRLGDGTPASFIARTYDDDYHFMLIEIGEDTLSFQAITREGDTLDAGTIHRRRAETAAQLRH
jgi:predicted phosphodiesterase